MAFSAFAASYAAVPLAAIAAAAIALVKGGPRQPEPLDSINAPFKEVDFSDLPALRRYTARDGASLAWRAYLPQAGAPQACVVLIHGSSASSASLHPLARQFAAAGYAACVPDVRGHGESGRKGTIAYIGQLEDDLEDLLAALPAELAALPKTLIGFSSGGGFALRFAGGARQRLFERYMLLAPFLHHKARTTRNEVGGWVSVGIPRLVVLAMFNGLHIRVFNHLPTIAYALAPEVRDELTPQYSFNLMQNFRPHDDYRADIRGARQPLHVLAGTEDEVFHAREYAAAFEEAGAHVPVTLVPGSGHIGLTLDAPAIATIIGCVKPSVKPCVQP
ncbi:alpha/beta hydrolase [Paraburkholderia guartelaensis]|uniref:alpha/beta hydrolase n=1 Tax=Paraburkholderia guartelaensis TaxID=2546446 RepID=UPI002AB60091|nr:alpha/beta fold hydrolase [Paraburkholderia guartelaensis]